MSKKMTADVRRKLGQALAHQLIAEVITHAAERLGNPHLKLQGGSDHDRKAIIRHASEILRTFQETVNAVRTHYRQQLDREVGFDVCMDWEEEPVCPHPEGRVSGGGGARLCGDCGQLV